jgi:tRNA(fMet)-specific endonuclease VapC
MIYALDANVVIEYLRQNKNIISLIVQKIQTDRVVVPPFVEFEVMRGIFYKSAQVQLLQFSRLLYYCDKLELDEQRVMYRAAKLHAERKRAGKSIEDVDLFIAAWCIECGAVLVTENVKHFEDVPSLTYENWNKR